MNDESSQMHEKLKSSLLNNASLIPRLKMLAIFFVCLSPVLMSYFFYFVSPPTSRVNYGTLLIPPPETKLLKGIDSSGRERTLEMFRGHWFFVVVSDSNCDAVCRDQLHSIKQVRLTTGKNRYLIDRVWFVLGEKPPALDVLEENEGICSLQVEKEMLSSLFPPARPGEFSDHIWLVDPWGRVIMRFPEHPDPNRIKKDLQRLLHGVNSREQRVRSCWQ